MAEGKTITLSQQEIQQLSAVLVDQDGEEALRFLREVIKDRIREPQSHACGPIKARS